MKILESNVGVLTNFEVLDMLRARGAKNDPITCLGVVSSSECKVYDYLSNGPACNQTREGVKEFKKRCEVFMKRNENVKLTKMEILNIVNLRPSGQAELFSIIPNLEKRFGISEDGNLEVVEEFLSMVHEVLPPPPEILELQTSDQQEINVAKAMEEN